MYVNIFVLCHTRLGTKDEAAFRKLWGGIFFFNSHSSDKRGIAVLVKEDTPITDIGIENVIKGNFSKLSFKIRDERVLIKYISAPNKDLNSNAPDNESREFFKKVMDNTNRDVYTHKIIVGTTM